MHRQLLLLFALLAVSTLAWDAKFTRRGTAHFHPSPIACDNLPYLGQFPSNYAPLQQFLARFAANVSRIVTETGVPSATVNLVYDQTTLWTHGYGLKNLSNPSAGAPNGNTMYRIASNTKIFTSLLMEILQDAGRFTICQQVSKHVPAFAPNATLFPSARNITFAQLASHMSGLPNSSPCGSVFGDCDFTNADMWEKIRHVLLVSAPGLIPQYSNLGFSVLGHAIEELMEVDWATLIKRRILHPLGMTRTGTSPTDGKFTSGLAIGYTAGPGGDEEANYLVDIGWDSPSGSMYSSANDMAKLMKFFFRDDVPYQKNTDQILDGMSIKEWRQPRYINKDGTGYGLVWEIYQNQIYTKGGSIDGYLSMFATHPLLKFGMTVLTSSDSNPAMELILDYFMSTAIAEFIEVLRGVQPTPHIPAVFRDELAGTYTGPGPNVIFSVEESDTYEVMVIDLLGFSLQLEYVEDYLYRISVKDAPLDCVTAQVGLPEYIYFDATNTSEITYTIPGLIYGFVGVKINDDQAESSM